jgi:GrpB-like predicted nucleotidyltransferase (UPF0157 family)
LNIEVVEYDSKWESEFVKSKTFFTKLLNTINVEIVHVGSTSVYKMWAKPILDIDIIVNDNEDKLKVIKKLESVGYKHLGNLNIEGREAFSYDDKNPYINWMNHHLYLCIRENEHLNNHLLLKKHLIENEEDRILYSNLKKELSKKFPTDIDSYIDGKTQLITSFLQKEGVSEASLLKIKKVNLKDKI